MEKQSENISQEEPLENKVANDSNSDADESSDKIESSPLIKIASFIVDKRMLFFLLYILVIIFSVFAKNWVKVEDDLAKYLSDNTETRRTIVLMDDQFTTFGSAKIMVANISYPDAQNMEKKISHMDGVSSVDFTDSEADMKDFVKHYNNGSALYTITFSYAETDDRALEALNKIKNELSDYDIYVSTSLGSQQADIIAEEMQKIILLVAVVVVTVLIITSQSYGEIPVLGLTFVVSMIINSGTNFLFGTISFVSNSVSSILQLALSVDYAIIFCNRYKEEYNGGLSVRDAVIVALSKSIPEIFSSSLTTISGLFALIFMQYKIGADMGIVLIKAILLSLLSVFTLMPGLIVIFSKVMDKTKHKNFVPKISWCGKLAYNTRHIVPLVFVGIFALAFYFSQNCPYVYGYSTLSTPVLNDTQIADNMITDTFGKENFVAVVVPGSNYSKESAFISALEQCKEVDHCVGLANTTAMDNYKLTDKLTPRQFSELLSIDYDACLVIYSAYAADKGEYGQIIGGISSYKITLMDMIQYAYSKIEEGYVHLDADTYKTLSDANKAITDGRKQLQGQKYDRILVYLTLPEESDETFAFLQKIHEIAEPWYEPNSIYVAGNSTSQRDLRTSFEKDNIVVSIVSAFFVLVILLFTFKSAGLPVLLIAVIEGAIFINFSFPTIEHQNLFFMGYLIVSSIQMGANIDYAIVISSRYTELRKTMSRKDSIIESLNFAFPTIITSGSMMILAGVFIGQMTSDPCIAGIGQCLGRGTLISVFLVMFVLPQILIVGDKIISMTTFDISRPVHTRNETGTIVVNGMIRGTINGTVIGSMNAVVRGDVSAILLSGDMEKKDDGIIEENLIEANDIVDVSEDESDEK
ncbi:efflux RND transporter permease subunit [Butyrivibrio sp. NC3005]|uniref:efflux RND transporter permease subunit n=1 Tax=Butyrivibrio sp. NC3005 TaxID=1280685 RepID=UPI00041F00D2|nr:MMPL family transporter [Butyrivibrio sp. NC3005]